MALIWQPWRMIRPGWSWTWLCLLHILSGQIARIRVWLWLVVGPFLGLSEVDMKKIIEYASL